MVLPFAVTTTKAAATASRPTEKAARPFTLLLLQLQPLRPATILHSTILLSLFKFGTTLAPTTLPSPSHSSQITRPVAVARLQGGRGGRHRPLGTRSLIPASVLDLQSCGDLNAHSTDTLFRKLGMYPFSTLTIQTVFDKIG